MKNQILPFLVSALLMMSACSKKDVKPDDKSHEVKDMIGCLGYAAGYSNSGTIGPANSFDFKNKQNNSFFEGEVSVQRNFWNDIPAAVHVLYESSYDYRNAYSTNQGQIYFGYEMFYFLVDKFSALPDHTASPLPVDGVLAHEWGHQVQFDVGWNDYADNAEREMEADFFSGYYMGLAKQWYWGQIQTYYNAIYSSGDYAYSDPTHHGTPQQRLNAAYAGLQVAVYELKNNVHYTYNQLHDIYKQNKNYINSHARLSGGAGSFDEVTYPKNLSRKYIESLYPHK